MNLQLDQGLQTILCLGAHADDIEIGCGATLRKILQTNPQVRIHWIVFSATGVRKSEALASVAALPVPDRIAVQTFEFRDAFFPAQWEALKQTFGDLKATIRPDLIFTHRLDDRHQDHRVVAELTWNAFRDQELIFEYEIPKLEGDLGKPNLFVPVAVEDARQKSAWVFETFQSQQDKPWFCAETFEALMRLRGLESGTTATFAEAFYCQKLSLRF